MTRLSDGSTIDDWRISTPAEIAYVEPLPDPAEVLAERVASALADLKDALNTLPAPQVHVAAPELGAIVQAVTSLNGPATAEDIAEAIARTLHVPEPESNQPLVDAIVTAFEKMDHRMKGMVPAFGASGPSNISSDANRLLGHVTVDNIVPVSGGLTDAELRATPPSVALDATSLAALEEVVPNRPSQGVGRVYKAFQVDAVTADTTAYTVTAGKDLYVTSWGGTMMNTSTVAMGHVRLRDGGAAGTILASWVIPAAIVGALAPSTLLNSTMPEPKLIGTDVFVDVVAGSVTVCFQATGYEQ